MEKRTLLSMALTVALPLLPLGCASPTSTKPGDPLAAFTKTTEPSLASRIGAGFKKGAAKATAALTPSPTVSRSATKVPVSLSSKPKKPGIDLYLSMAQASERMGNFPEAEKQYQAALKQAPNDLDALLAYAHALDRQGKFVEASKFYKRATEKHPQESGAFNDLGLCYHRRAMLPEATDVLGRAIELHPDRKLYRNNLAAVLVDMGNIDAALVELKAAHGDAVGHYNMGYMLAKKGQELRAVSHFRQAVAADPSLVAAQEWIARLAPPAASPLERGPAVESIATKPDRPPVPTTPVPPVAPETGNLPAEPAPAQAPSNSAPERL